MYRLILLLFLSTICFAEEDSWIKQAAARSDPEAVAWLKEHLLEFSPVKAGELSIENGSCSNESELFIDPKLFVFMSFSIPDVIWISLSHELEKVDGVFVLRGLPQQSFRELAAKILSLKEKSVSAPIQLDPKQFQAYQLTSVPAFIVTEDEQFDKVTGNVSLKFALELMAKKGETSTAKLFYQLLEAK
ncbi:MAG: type-F conjugative transfer system pilin assembly protein TrbC [Chlamydiales bacterium]